MSRAKKFRIYTSPWLAETAGLRADELGIYVTLLAMSLDREEPISADAKHLARYLGCTEGRLQKVLTGLQEQGFIAVRDGCVQVLLAPGLSNGVTVQPRAGIPVKVRSALVARDGFRCRYCGTERGPFEIDHVLPWSRGGTNDLDNLVMACQPCNRKKSDRTPEEMGWLL